PTAGSFSGSIATMLFRPAWCWKTEWFLLRSEVKQGLRGRIETDARQCLVEEHN
ncbi:unnamed protein product, partial [Musa acuminata subsp. burmannicoides]